MKLLATVSAFLCLSTLTIAASLSFTNLQDPQTNPLFGQLISDQEFDPNSKTQATAAAMSALLTYMAPNIKSIPDYAGYFSGNCSVFFDNTSIHQVNCNIIPVAIVSVNETQQFNSPIRLPYQYATQITQSHILLAGLLADWTRKIAQKLEQFEVSLFEKAPTCTISESITTTQNSTATDTWVATPTSSPSQLASTSNTQKNSNTLSELVSHTLSSSKSATSTRNQSYSTSIIDSNSHTNSKSNTTLHSDSVSRSQSDYPICSLNLYADATSQPARYLVIGSASNSTVTDLWTGLAWEQIGSELAMTWLQAQDYCASISKGGFTDWRLPGITELQSLVDYTVGNPGPTMDATAFHNTPVSQTWTSVQSAGNSGYSWAIDFALGQISSDTDNNPKAVRCVRGDSVILLNRYTDEDGYPLNNQSTQVRDVLSGLTWERILSASYVTWSAAQAYCQNLTLGATSWRLPTIKELTSLIDYDCYSPAINQTAFPMPTSNFFWSSTPFMDTSGNGWIASFAYNGLVEYDNTVGDTNHALCVRDSTWASEAYADATHQTDRYVIAGNDPEAVVTDTFTGLMWEQTSSPKAMTWENASSYCAGLVKGNYGCWRLPTPQELQSLIDFTLSNPAIDTTVFFNTPLNPFWASAIYAGTTTGAWSTNFASGYTDGGYSNTNYNIRCVRKTSVDPAVRYTNENGNQLTSQDVQVKDQITGLIWQRAEANGFFSWDANATGSAQGYCQNLVIERRGTGDWCLPTARQLASLVDYSIANPGPTINMTAFPDTAQNGYWSSTRYTASLGSAWNLYFAHGALIFLGTNRVCNVRCILCNSATSNNGMWSPLAYEDATNQTARYSVSGTTPNAIVTDDFTGLMWEQQVSSSTYFWNASAPAGSAQAYCTNLAKGGYLDWRLPTHREFWAITDYTIAVSPAIMSSVFPGTPSSKFWTATRLLNTDNSTWYIDFLDGSTYFDLSNIGYKVRCVRGSVVSISNRYQDSHGNQLTDLSTKVLDMFTGFVWQRRIAPQVLPWNSAPESAKSYCQNLVIEEYGASSWSLPTVKQLNSLEDYSKYNPSINNTVFPGPITNYHVWSSTPLVRNPNYAWLPFFGTGNGGSYGLLPNTYLVRCILNSSAPPNNGMWSPLAYQDATNQVARYSVSGSSPNTIVTDDFTGLMWEQQVSPSTYLWNASAPAGSAQAYCTSLTKGGYADWRLPSVSELQSLVDYTIYSPAINSAAFQGATGYFWTNSLWDLRFSNAGIIAPDGGLRNVRCVRGSTYFPATRYVDENENILSNSSLQVKDLVTGLIWQRRTASALLQGSSQTYCPNLVVGNQGAGSWRLPTTKELTSLFNTSITGNAPRTDIVAFFDTQTGPYWTSTPGIGSGLSEFCVSFGSGNIVDFSYNNMLGTAHVRCILNASAPANDGMWSPLAYEDATNQTARYYISGTSPNAIVTDDFTGLMWEQTGSSVPLTWNATSVPGSIQAYCDNLNKGTYLDWRVPNIVELQSLEDYTLPSAGPTINQVVFPGTQIGCYWTSIPAPGTLVPWHASFGASSNYGGAVCNPLTQGDCVVSPGYARCVRGGKESVSNRYADEFGNPFNSTSTQISDQVTGLIWQRTQAATIYNWSAAQGYCQNLALAGQLWRLPSIKELTTLVNYTIASGPMIHVEAFPGTPSAPFWSSTTTPGGLPWNVFFSNGFVCGGIPGYNSYHVRCVR